jgi:ubiquinone/menaquinone biosynthesis C-methylase UbiE
MNKASQPKHLILLRQVSSFTTSRIILTANNYRMFDHLEGSGRTAASLARIISADKRATELLLDSLVGVGLLRKATGFYRNTPATSRYLVRGKPDYQGDILRHYSVLWDNWSGLDKVLKSGKPYKKSFDHKSFILGMHNLASQRVKSLMNSINVKGVRNLLDLGGGPGTYAMAFAKKNIHVTLMDYPETLRIARRLIKDAGLTGKIKLLPGDFTRDPIGNHYDLILISQIFHAYSEKESREILKQCRRALNPGGRVVIHEFFINEDRTSPPFSAIFAINMLVNTTGGRTYTPNEMSSWMKKTGFSGISKKVMDDTVLVTGTKK